MSDEKDKLFGIGPYSGFDAIRESYGPPAPLTAERMLAAIQDGFEKMKNAPRKEPIRYVSHAVWQRCQDAIAAGASEREVMLVSYGWSLEAAREACK